MVFAVVVGVSCNSCWSTFGKGVGDNPSDHLHIWVSVDFARNTHVQHLFFPITQGSLQGVSGHKNWGISPTRLGVLSTTTASWIYEGGKSNDSWNLRFYVWRVRIVVPDAKGKYGFVWTFLGTKKSDGWWNHFPSMAIFWVSDNVRTYTC